AGAADPLMRASRKATPPRNAKGARRGRLVVSAAPGGHPGERRLDRGRRGGLGLEPVVAAPEVLVLAVVAEAGFHPECGAHVGGLRLVTAGRVATEKAKGGGDSHDGPRRKARGVTVAR